MNLPDLLSSRPPDRQDTQRPMKNRGASEHAADFSRAFNEEAHDPDTVTNPDAAGKKSADRMVNDCEIHDGATAPLIGSPVATASDADIIEQPMLLSFGPESDAPDLLDARPSLRKVAETPASKFDDAPVDEAERGASSETSHPAIAARNGVPGEPAQTATTRSRNRSAEALLSASSVPGGRETNSREPAPDRSGLHRSVALVATTAMPGRSRAVGLSAGGEGGRQSQAPTPPAWAQAIRDQSTTTSDKVSADPSQPIGSIDLDPSVMKIATASNGSPRTARNDHADVPASINGEKAAELNRARSVVLENTPTAEIELPAVDRRQHSVRGELAAQTDTVAPMASAVHTSGTLAASAPRSEPGTSSGRILIERSLAPQLVAAVSSRPGGGVIDLTLDPPELGRIEIALDLGEQGIRATLAIERFSTGDLIRRHMDQLTQQFQDAGFSEVDLNFASFRGGGADSDRDGAEGKTGTKDPIETDQRRPSIRASTGSIRDGRVDLRL